MNLSRKLFLFASIALTVESELVAQTQSWTKIGFGNQTINQLLFDSRSSATYATVTYFPHDSLYRSTNQATSWNAVARFQYGIKCIQISPSNSDLWVSAHDSIFKSTDAGSTWSGYRIPGRTDLQFTLLSNERLAVFSTANWDTVFTLSAQGVITDRKKTTGIPPAFYPNKIWGYGGDTVFLWGTRLFRSPDAGQTWSESDSGFVTTPTTIAQIVSNPNGSLIYLQESYYRLYKSTNFGTSWMAVPGPLINASHIDINSKGSVLVAGYYFFADLGAAFFHRNSSDTIVALRNGFAPLSEGVSVVFLDTNKALVGCLNDGLYKSDILTSVKLASTLGTVSAQLESIYPNPFNPKTTITFSLLTSEYTRLSIVNELGQDICVLESGILRPGQYRLSWDATSLSSGVYFVTLRVGESLQSKRILLLK